MFWRRVQNWLVPVEETMSAETHLRICADKLALFYRHPSLGFLDDIARHASKALNTTAFIEVDGEKHDARFYAHMSLFLEAYYRLNYEPIDHWGKFNVKGLTQAWKAIEKAQTYYRTPDSDYVRLRILFNLPYMGLYARQELNKAIRMYPDDPEILKIKTYYTETD